MTVILDSPIRLYEIGCITESAASFSDDIIINKICTDSREAHHGCLFFALDGAKRSGNDFITSAKERGAVTLGTSSLSDVAVSNVETALLSLARYYKKNYLKSIRSTVAITGSVGKTTTKEFLCTLLEDKHKIHATSGNYNNTLGVPLTVFSAPRDTEILICELGMNALGEIDKLSRCVNPDVSVITNIGTAHIGRLGSKEKIAEAKLEILNGMTENSTLFVPYGEELLKNKGKTFSISSPKADVAILGDGNLNIFSQGKKIGKSSFLLSGYNHRECLAAALAAGLYVGTPTEVIAAIPKISSIQTREKIYRVRNFYVFDDAYNASYESIDAALNRLFYLSGYTSKSVLLGDVLELGAFSEEIHIKIGRLLARISPRQIFLYGQYAKFTAIGAESMGIPKSRLHSFEVGEEHELAEKIKKLAKDGEIMLIKGSRGMHLEKIVEYING